MKSSVISFFFRYEWLLVLLLVVVFVSIRLPGTSLPLHQDEYKWPSSVDPSNPTAFIPHPPIGAFIYETAGRLLGYDQDFRFVPLFFGAANLLLLYYLVRFIFDRRTAFIAGLIWIFSYFSVLASLMVDTDGQIMPFFFLLALIAYFKLKLGSGRRSLWGVLLLITLFLGIMDKLSFALSIGAIVADFLWFKRQAISKKDLIKFGAYGLGTVVLLSVFLLVARFIFPFFDLSRSLTYWKHFIVFDRGWFQTFIQCVKALLYSSPFLVFAPFLYRKTYKTFPADRFSPFVFFLIFAFIFYVILFDFSIGALDRYLQLLILPLTMFAAPLLSDLSRNMPRRGKEFLLLGSALALIFVLLQSVPHYVPSLHPKAEWLSHLVSFRWNFLYPFSGGSGPLGFYVSFLFIALSWMATLVAVILAMVKKNAALAICFILPIGVIYNAIFIEEYLIGLWNGHAPKLVEASVEYIRNNPDIKKVIVYNDNGAEEVRTTGKYFRRLYADPAFEEGYKKILDSFSGHLLYIDVPRMNPDSLYRRYMDSCRPIYQNSDKYMNATVYDCRSGQL